MVMRSVLPAQSYATTSISGTQTMTDMMNAIMPLMMAMMMMAMMMPMMKGITEAR
jgi:hypothetical protein